MLTFVINCILKTFSFHLSPPVPIDFDYLKTAILSEVFVNNKNLTFLTFLYKNWHEASSKFRQKIKLPPVGIELKTDHH